MKDLKKYSKFLVALGAALGVAGVALADGNLSGSEILQIVVAFGGSLGVFQAKNTKG